MIHDALVEALSGTIETLDDGSTVYRNSAGAPHRVGGPAYETTYGLKEWFLSGSPYSEAEYLIAQRRLNAN